MLITDYLKITRALQDSFWFSLNVATFKEEIFIVNDDFDDKGERFILGKGKDQKVSLRGRESSNTKVKKDFDVLEMMQTLAIIYCIEYEPEETEQRQLSVLFQTKTLKKSVIDFVVSNEFEYLMEDEERIKNIPGNLTFLTKNSLIEINKRIERQLKKQLAWI